jgi:hypothetical protein
MDKDGTEGAPVRTRRSIMLPLLAIVVLGLPIYKLVLVDRLGFCPSRLGFTSSNELILKQVDVLMKSGLMKLDSADSSPAAYLARHPKCCRADWGDDHGGPFDRGMTCFGSATVAVNYELSEEGRKVYRETRKPAYYESLVNYTACGKALDSTGGA